MPVTINHQPIIPSNPPDYASAQTRHPGLLEKLRALSRIQGVDCLMQGCKAASLPAQAAMNSTGRFEA